ncbi:LAMI_0E11782g1_1 [Lachancea mirantina]|uniref:ferric-chelate reductase (NADPH) n=1 Tax=Lachancea mirantina TaxID=1230905 RepID=A0A1G4JPN9_9SACH|nr:LAMI_0E11782g1_1 [Lachancea mirantina]
MKFVLAVALLVSAARALVLVDSTLASACIYYELKYDWGCKSHGNGMAAYKCRCGNVNWLGTITNCIVSNSKQKHLVDHALKHVATRCRQKGDFHYTLEDMWGFYENGTQFRRDPTKADLTTPVMTTLNVNQTQFDWYYRKFKDMGFAVQRSQWFGWGLVFYWAAVIGFATALNLNEKFFGFKLIGNRFSTSLVSPSFLQPYSRKIAAIAYRILPSPYPNRLQVIAVAIFIVQTIITAGVGYNVKLPHPYLKTQWFLNIDMLSYRVDMMAISLLPVIFFFGIRNNPFIPLTGLSCSSFNYFHKWCAYVCAILSFIHSILWTVDSMRDGGYRVWWMDSYWQHGIAAMVFLSLLAIHSFKVFRDQIYEIFLALHKIMSIFFIITMYYHLKDMGWLGWIWSMVGILAFDRIARIIRIGLSGGLQQATITDCGDGIIKLSLIKPKYFAYIPGSFSYIYFMSPHDPWYHTFQSHPFTLLSEPKETSNDRLMMYFKAKKGITNHLLNKILISGKESVNVRILLEGPYGGDMLPQKVHTERKVVGVAAGLGITAVYAQSLRLINSQKTQTANRLYWIVRDLRDIDWFSEELKFLQSKSFEISVLCTCSREFDQESSSLDSDIKFMGSLDIQMLYKRPDLAQLVKDELVSASKVSEEVTFVICGPASFNTSFREIYHEETKATSIGVSLKEESFTW